MKVSAAAIVPTVGGPHCWGVILRRLGAVAGYQQGQAERDQHGADVKVVPGQERDPGDEREQLETMGEVVHEPGSADDAQQEADRLECLRSSHARSAARTGASRVGAPA